MIEIFTGWLSEHFVEVLGAILGIIYIFLSIRQNIFTWPIGLLTSAMYIYVFFQTKFYADMGLQVYYVGISIYGWYYWIKGGKNENRKELAVTNTGLKIFLYLIPVTAIIYGIILFILLNYTDSPVPYMDSMTTALSIVATWMLARKLIEHWIIWIFVDLVSAGLYIYKGMWPTTILFIVYTVMAVIGFFQWKKNTGNG
ncbi:MAG: nicotinamide mononucleotide transporter [Prolixibacteraceae bacterium]|nr:nicotinamide mononucleotide transporter [Prolixibacteraceae bacterium]MBN2774677.1 nicotinamide mononucleotide transporter [Prolixibacteraceae bacterium]